MTSSPLLTTVSDLLIRLEVVAAKLFAMLGRTPAALDAEVLTIQQAAKYSVLSPTKIRREIKASRLPASNAGSEARPLYRIQKTDLLEWLEQKKGGSSLPPKAQLKKLVKRYFPDR